MSEYHDLVQALTWLITHKLQARGEYTRGLLGDGQGHVQVPGRDDFTYVRPDRYTTRVFEVFNKQVSGPDGLPIILGELPWQPGLTQVLDVDWETYYGVGWGNATPGGRLHGPTHEWHDSAPGVDTFNVYTRQIAPLRTYPVGSGSTSVYVSAYNLNHLGDIKSWPGTLGRDLSAAIPSATGTARFVLTYWDPASGTSGYIGIATGTIGLDVGTETLDRPAPPAGTIPSAWVRLAGGQSSITEFDIWDARMPWMPSLEFGTGSGAIHAGLIPISDVGGYYTGSTVEAALEEAATAGGGPPSGAAGGDLTGTYPNPQVAGLRSSIVDGEAPTEGYLLTYTGSAWRPRPAPVFPGIALPTGPAGGDLTGSYPDPLVAGLFGYSLLNSAPSEGDVLMFTGSAWRPTAGISPWKLGNTVIVSSSGRGDYDNLTDAFNNVSSGDTVLIDVEGSLPCAALTAPAGVHVKGMGRDVTTLVASNATFVLELSAGCTLRDIYVHQLSAGDAVYISGSDVYMYDVKAVGTSVGANGVRTIDTGYYFFNCDLYGPNYALMLDGSNIGGEMLGGRLNGTTADVYLGDNSLSYVDVYNLPVFVTGNLAGSGYVHGWYFTGFGTRQMIGSHTTAVNMEQNASAPSAPDTSHWQFYFKASGAYVQDAAGTEVGPLAAVGPPTGAAGGDLTGTYPNPLVAGLFGYSLLSNAPAEGDVLMFTGSAWSPIPRPTTANAWAFVVKNTSGGAVSAGAVGYIDSAGEFKTTTTAYLDAEWAVVVIGGANNADVYVARRGRVPVTLNGNCSAGDYLYTSTTAGQAQPQSYVRPELFAVALTANGAGAGGTCSALLLTGRKMIPIQSDNAILSIQACSDSTFVGTINALPGGADLTYNITSGNEDTLVPQNTTELGKIVLHNTTQGDSALISTTNIGTNTITLTAAVPGTWGGGDTITTRSQTNADTVFAAYFYDIEITSSEIPALTTTLQICVHEWRDSGSTGQVMFLHTYETGSTAKRQRFENNSTSGNGGVGQTTPLGIFDRRFTVLWNASGAGTADVEFRARGVVVASP